MNRAVKTACLLIFLLEFLSPGPAGAEGINWVSYPEGITRAARSQRPMLVLFYSPSCRVCSVLDKKVFSDPEIIDYLKANLVPVKLDIARSKELVTRYRIFGTPTIYFLKPDSTPIDFLAGYVEPEKFLTIIRYIGEKAYEKTTYEEYLRKNGK